jgi:hypothetical protein
MNFQLFFNIFLFQSYPSSLFLFITEIKKYPYQTPILYSTKPCFGLYSLSSSSSSSHNNNYNNNDKYNNNVDNNNHYHQYHLYHQHIIIFRTTTTLTIIAIIIASIIWLSAMEKTWKDPSI